MSLRIESISGGKKLEAHLEKLKGDSVHLRVGILEGSTYPDGTNTALVGFVHEFGVPNKGIPPRSFMRSTVLSRVNAWKAGLGKEIKIAGYAYPKALERLGTVMRDDIKKQIRAITKPALKPATVARKGFETVLIDTGHLVNSIQHEVANGKSE